jgi:hypothetical protein
MIAVTQCAARKCVDAGYLRNEDGERIMIVADPSKAPSNDGLVYARPDDLSGTGVSWRKTLDHYNTAPGNNPLGLVAAYKLYDNPAYQRLAKHLGIEKMYILSAGWGLIRADFLTPHYDVTFSTAVKRGAPYKYRRKDSHYADFKQMPSDSDEPVVFFGGKDYVPQFATLTQGVKTRRTVYYNSRVPPEAPGCKLINFSTTTKTNWHYGCVDAFIEGRLDLTT